MFYIAPELQRDLPLVVEVLRASLPDEQQREALDQLHKQCFKVFESKRKEWETADAQEFNTDSVYKERIDYAIEFKHKSIVELVSKLVHTHNFDVTKKKKVCGAVCVATDNKADELNTHNFVHVMSMEGRYDLAEAALSVGFTGDASLVRRDGATPLALAILLPDRLAGKSNMLTNLAGKSKIFSLMLTTDINDDYLRQLSMAFFKTSNILRWLADGWSPETGTQIGSPLTVDWYVNSVAFSPDGSKIAAANLNEIQIFDAQTKGKIGSPLSVDSGEYGVQSISYSPAGDMIAAGCWNGKIHILDTVTVAVKRSLNGHRYRRKF